MHRTIKPLLMTTALALLPEPACAQSSPGWSFGFTPSAAQWNAAFAGKQDYTGTVPLNITGGAMLGELTTTASTINSAGFNITPGTAPNSPNNGDMWTTSAGLFVQINGSTAQLSAGTAGSSSLLATNNTWTGTNQFNLATTFGSGVTFNSGAPITVNGTATFGAFTYFDYNAVTTTPNTGTGAAISNNYSNSSLETDIWNTGTGATVSFLFKQMTGAGTFKNLVDISLGTGSAGGIIDIYGLTSGKISLMGGSAAAGTYNWIYPTTAGAAGQILTSQGGTGAMTWSSAGAGTVTSAQVSGSAGVTVQGTCTITVSGNCTIGAYLGPPQGRLSLLNGTAIMLSTNAVAGSKNLFYTPYTGVLVPIYNGTSLQSYQFSTGSVGLTLNLNASGNWALNSLFDAFITLNGTAVVLCTGSAWSSATARAANLSVGISPQGIMTNNGTGTFGCRTGSATTITVSQYQATYVGTFATDAATAGQVSFTYGSAGSGGVASVLNLWNYYNRVTVTSTVTDNGTTYSYTPATTRQSRASAGNQITFVSGFAEDGGMAFHAEYVATQAAAAAFGNIGIGLDSTSTFANQVAQIYDPVSTAGIAGVGMSTYYVPPQIGQHVLSANEAGDGTNANNFDNSSNASFQANLQM